MCCKWWKWRTGGPKGSQNGNPTSDLQVAADRIIMCAVRWYLRYSLSPRDVEELLDERGLNWSSGYGDISSRPTNPGGRRDLRSSAGPLVLPVSGDRFGRCHH